MIKIEQKQSTKNVKSLRVYRVLLSKKVRRKDKRSYNIFKNARYCCLLIFARCNVYVQQE